MKFFLLFLFSFSLYSVELSKATNNQLVSELSRRLGTTSHSNNSGTLISYCMGDDLVLELETLRTSTKKVIDTYSDNECESSVKKLKKGNFNTFMLSAFCVTDDLHRVKSTSRGDLEIAITDMASNGECLKSASVINEMVGL
ncbi:MAG: hypothetical protein N4A33_08345 [Bacteriovoracaceae bacterium]|jgi:hypothetical protein|nr:hypothetical protein [Bacteriovoracaceae bacterium]